MGLFIAPFSGNAVGGGGHGVIDPPPPGIDVDTPGRVPLRLLKPKMNRHKPKLMNIVPPGQWRGTVAPPYTWDAVERDDWRYDFPNRKRFREDTAGAPSTDPRMARIQAIQRELDTLRAQVKELLSRQHQLVQAGKASLQRPTEALRRGRLLLLSEADEFEPTSFVRPETPEEMEARRKRPVVGPAELRPDWLHQIEKRQAQLEPEPLGLSRTPLRSLASKRREERRRQLGSGLATRGLAPPRPTRPAPTQSAEIIQIHKQLEQKRAEIENLVNELRQLRAQMHQEKGTQGASESTRLGSNTRRSLKLLLK